MMGLFKSIMVLPFLALLTAPASAQGPTRAAAPDDAAISDAYIYLLAGCWSSVRNTWIAVRLALPTTR